MAKDLSNYWAAIAQMNGDPANIFGAGSSLPESAPEEDLPVVGGKKVVPLAKAKQKLAGADQNRMVDETTNTDTLKNEIKDQNRNQTQRDLFLSPEEFEQQAASVRGTPEFAAQNNSIDDINAEIERLRKMKTNQASWLPPLIALTDSETGSNLMKGYQPGFTEKDKAALIAKLVADVAARRGDMSNRLLQGVKGMRAGQQLQQVVQSTGQTGTQQAQVKETDTQQQGFKPPPKGGGKGGPKSKFFDAADTALGKQYSDWIAAGGGNVSAEDLRTYDNIISRLKSGKLSSGTADSAKSRLGNLVGIKTDLQVASDEISRISASSLKKLFPGAISDAEREFITNLSFDKSADPKDNIRRLTKAKNILERANRKQTEAMEFASRPENGTIRGFNWGTGDASLGAGAGGKFTDAGGDKVRVKNKATGKVGSIPKSQLQKALKSGKFEQVQ